MEKKRKKKFHLGKFLLYTFGTLILVGAVSFALFCVYFVNYAKGGIAADAEIHLEDYTLDQTSSIYYQDRDTGEWKELQRLYASEDRIWTDYNDIPTNLIFACVAIEDKRFFEHSGVDWITTVKACASMFIGKSSFGGSTITQQLVKNLTGDDEVTVHRKLTEIYRALKLEEDYSKQDIMEMYLNTIYLGESCYGVESAARKYFGKDVWDLTLAECASLIGITNNPSAYDPYIYPENNIRRQNWILNAMYDQGYITEDELNEALSQELVFTSVSYSASENDSGYYSYFVDEVIREVISDLMDQYGLTYQAANLMLTSGGYSIYSTVDIDVQNALEKVFENEDNLPDTESSQQLQGAMVVIDNSTGDIAGIVGGTGKKTGSLVWDRATQSTLEPGSVLKPVTVYACALEAGLITPSTVMDDIPSRFTDTACWPPNSDGVYRGLVSMRTAVAKSLNTISVALVDKLTAKECYRFATEQMGLTTLVEKDGDLTDLTSWAMGMGALTYGVNLEEITEAYAAFANQGIYRTARTYTRVEDSDGNIILSNAQESRTAVSEKTAWYLTYMMEETVNSGTGVNAALDNMPVAGKTGTTDNTQDCWFGGYTPYYTAICWTGYDTPESIVTTDGSGSPAVSLWQKAMSLIHQGLSEKSFSRPNDIIECTVCQDSGKLVSEACRADPRGDRSVTTYLALEDVPTEACDCHKMVEICGESGMLATTYCKRASSNTITKVGLLNVARYFPIEGITVQDEQYNYLDSVPDGYFRATSPVSTQYDLTCPVHVQDVDVVTIDDLINQGSNSR